MLSTLYHKIFSELPISSPFPLNYPLYSPPHTSLGHKRLGLALHFVLSFFFKGCSSHAAGAHHHELILHHRSSRDSGTRRCRGRGSHRSLARLPLGPGLGWGRLQGPGYVFFFIEKKVLIYF